MGTIVEDIRSGDRTAFRELFEDYYPMLCVFACRYLADEERCKDVAQETLLSYWEARTDFDALNKVKAFLYTVARNKCLNLIKRDEMAGNSMDRFSEETGSSPEDEVLRQETYLLVRKAVGALPSQMHRIIELGMQGKKNAEIAQEMGISEGTVHSLKKTAYRKLRILLKEHYFLLLFCI